MNAADHGSECGLAIGVADGLEQVACCADDAGAVIAFVHPGDGDLGSEDSEGVVHP